MQILAVDGVEVLYEPAAGVRRRLDHTGRQHQVVVRYNPKGYSSAARSLLESTGSNATQTVIIHRRKDDNSFGLYVAGGAETGIQVIRIFLVSRNSH